MEDYYEADRGKERSGIWVEHIGLCRTLANEYYLFKCLCKNVLSLKAPALKVSSLDFIGLSKLLVQPKARLWEHKFKS